MFAVRVSPYAACFTTGGDIFELNQFYFRRAWGMTAKDSALPDSRVAGVTPCPSSLEIKRPARAGIKNFEKMVQQQADYGETSAAFLLKSAMTKTLNKKL